MLSSDVEFSGLSVQLTGMRTIKQDTAAAASVVLSYVTRIFYLLFSFNFTCNL